MNHTIVFVLACLVAVGYTHRPQAIDDQIKWQPQEEQSSVAAGAASSLNSLATFLLANSQAAAFNPSMLRTRSSAAYRSGAPHMSSILRRGGESFTWDAARGLYLMSEPGKDPDKEPSRPGPRPMTPLPMVGVGDDKVDVMSRLLRDRILLLGTQVGDEMANVLVAQLLYLANEDAEKDITMYINSPGGSVSAGMAIFDTMQFVPCDVGTNCFGLAASMGAFLLGAGTKGKRRSLPNSRIMIHQPLGGAQGQAADIEIQAKEILFIRALLNEYIAEYTGQPLEKIEEDTDRDFYMTAEEAKDYGIIDEVLKSKVRIPTPPPPQLLMST